MLDIMSIIQLVHAIFNPHEMHHLKKQMNNEFSCYSLDTYRSIPQILAIKTFSVTLSNQKSATNQQKENVLQRHKS